MLHCRTSNFTVVVVGPMLFLREQSGMVAGMFWLQYEATGNKTFKVNTNEHMYVIIIIRISN